LSTAQRIVETLLEADEVDPKRFTARHSDAIYNTWEQVDGDVDWWNEGGTFHNPGLNMLIHVDSSGLKDWAAWDIKLKPQDEAEILAQFPVKIDPEWPEGGDENEQARDDATENRRQEIADEKNAARKVHVYRWLDDHIQDYLGRLDQTLTFAGMSYEEFDNLSLGAKWAVLGQMLGYAEFDSYPDTYTEAELDAYLQPRDDFRGRSRQHNHLPDNP
jgi:hypothetical protein